MPVWQELPKKTHFFAHYFLEWQEKKVKAYDIILHLEQF